MKSEIKTALILVMGIAAAVGVISILFSSLDSELEFASITENGIDSAIDKSKFKKAPDLVGIAHYLNTTPEQLASEMKGRWYFMIYGHIVASIALGHFHTLHPGMTNTRMKD